MQRLITFGCSLTYGCGLPDCYNAGHTGDLPSKMGWPSITAKYMNRECVNMSVPGVSNKFIWKSIMDFKFNSSDAVIIHWTYPNRTCLIKKGKVEHMGNWTGHDLYYERFYDDHDALLNSQLYVNHANNFLESLDVEVHNIIVKPEDKSILNLNDEMVASLIPVYISAMRDDYPLALDSHHPGIECNTQFAKSILETLKIKNDIPHQEPLDLMGKVQRRLQYLRNKKNV